MGNYTIRVYNSPDLLAYVFTRMGVFPALSRSSCSTFASLIHRLCLKVRTEQLCGTCLGLYNICRDVWILSTRLTTWFISVSVCIPSHKAQCVYRAHASQLSCFRQADIHNTECVCSFSWRLYFLRLRMQWQCWATLNHGLVRTINTILHFYPIFLIS
jgi:hypothetical protein